MPSVAVVIVNYRSAPLAAECLDGLAAARANLPTLRVVVVDGASRDGSAETLARLCAEPRFAGWTEVLPLEINGGFGWANNQAMLRLLQSDEPPEFIHLLNPDAVPEPDAVRLLAEALQADPMRGAAGSLLLEPDGQSSGSAFRFPSIGREFQSAVGVHAVGRLLGIKDTVITSDTTVPAEWVTGASVMFRSAALREVGLFDDGFFLYFEEVELMWRLRKAGWDIVHVPGSRVMHIGGGSTGVKNGKAGRARAPGYLYEARRRMFLLTRGRAYLLAAGLSWLAGHLVWWLRTLVSTGAAADVVPFEARDRIAIGMKRRSAGDKPATVVWNDRIGVKPAWMRGHEA